MPSLKERYEAFSPFLNERMRRLFVATEANLIGHGGVDIVSQEKEYLVVLARGRKELKEISTIKIGRISRTTAKSPKSLKITKQTHLLGSINRTPTEQKL